MVEPTANTAYETALKAAIDAALDSVVASPEPVSGSDAIRMLRDRLIDDKLI